MKLAETDLHSCCAIQPVDCTPFAQLGHFVITISVRNRQITIFGDCCA
ncbi:hypothetical protein CEV31_3045 [Brucella thiophenivorans]|uniref:Uncharacterized protein n=1 Tax=Brucella thiophenivorans TaxID=571255 RepID=A0A256FJG6_9HYPH|nr:hypothetical protein CEV31_3045 [Brucella thiophenivorans]